MTDGIRKNRIGKQITGFRKRAGYFALCAVLLTLWPMRASAAPRLQDTGDKLVIVIDPGHGGENQGTIENGYEEKGMTMVTARAMYEELSLYEDVEVYLTRAGDRDLTLKERAEFAASVDADFLFSIHYNASASHELFGSEVWVSVFPPFNGYGYQFGRELLADLRGAGNILGKEQHGHMQKVGYDMYVRLLEEVTREVAGEKTAAEKEIKMELVLDAFISEQYIPSQDERIIYYSRISKIASQGEFAQTINSLKEQYGDMPREVENLCRIAYLKNLASNFNVKKIVINSSDCNVHLYKSEQVIDERLSKISGFYDARLKFEETPILKLNFTGKVIDKVKKLTEMFEKALQM